MPNRANLAHPISFARTVIYAFFKFIFRINARYGAIRGKKFSLLLPINSWESPLRRSSLFCVIQERRVHSALKRTVCFDYSTLKGRSKCPERYVIPLKLVISPSI